MPIKKPFKEAPKPAEASARTSRIYYNPYKEEMKPAMRWPSKTMSIDVYRTDPKTGKLESLAHKYDVGFGNQLDEASARQPIDPGMLHAISDANKITPALGVTPREMVSLLAQEGRTDFGANDLNVEHFAHNKQAVDLYSKLKDMGYDEMQAGLPALMLEKKRVADKLNVPWQAAWQGMGTTETGRTHKDYMRELNLNAQNVGANKPALDVFTKEMQEPSNPRELSDVNMRAWVARQKMVQSEREKMKATGASDKETQRAFPDAPIPFPEDPNAGLYELTQKYAKGGKVTTDKEPTLGQKLENLSYGLGEGFGHQMEGLGIMVAHPIESGKTIVKGVKAMIEDPSLIKQAAMDIADRATSSTEGLGEVIGENVSPVGAVKRLAAIGRPMIKEITVYHGTPHRFEPTEANPLGEFNASKIGTGEGAQAYGHGVYLAESPDVAEGYRIALSYDPEKMRIGGKQINEVYDQINTNAARMPAKMAQTEYEKMELLERLMLNNSVDEVSAAAGEMSPATKLWFEKQVRPKFETYGSLYKADLPDEMVGRMLDWDKPLTQQSKIAKTALAKFGESQETINAYDDALLKALFEDAKAPVGVPRNPTGAEIVKKLENQLGRKEASDYLRQLNIPGIKYQDAGSRGQAGSGTRNFVVFPNEEKNVTILERKAEGGLVAPTAQMSYDPTRVQSIADQLRQEMYND